MNAGAVAMMVETVSWWQVKMSPCYNRRPKDRPTELGILDLEWLEFRFSLVGKENPKITSC